MIPLAVTDAAISDELPGAMAWANRRQIAMDTRSVAGRIIRAVFSQPENGEKFYLQGTFDGYRAYPPIWEWYDESWNTTEGLHLSPHPGDSPFGSSMFIKHDGRSIICAHFNRLAYGVHNGPHSDWGNPAQWITAGHDYVHAVTIGDMLNSILRDFRFSEGRMR